MFQLTSLITGIIFGLGLAISNMNNPNKVLAFLDITGEWDASLLFVMLAAVIVYSIGFRLITKKQKPIYNNSFEIPTNKQIDKKLILGAILFGLGWGTAGYCPGPGFCALAIGSYDPLYFVIAMIIGSLGAVGNSTILAANR